MQCSVEEIISLIIAATINTCSNYLYINLEKHELIATLLSVIN